MFGNFIFSRKIFGKPTLLVGLSIYLITWGVSLTILNAITDYDYWIETLANYPINDNLSWYIQNTLFTVLSYIHFIMPISAGYLFLKSSKLGFWFLLAETIFYTISIITLIATMSLAPEEIPVEQYKSMFPSYVVSFLFLLVCLSYVRYLIKTGHLK